MDDVTLRRLVEVRHAGRTGLARALRVEAGLSIAEVAGAVGVCAPTVSRWERSLRVPRGEPARRYAALLEELAR